MAPPHAPAACFRFHATLLAACVVTTVYGTAPLPKAQPEESSASAGPLKEIVRPVVEEDDRQVTSVHQTAVTLPFFDKVGSEDDADEVFNMTNGTEVGIILDMKCRGCVDKRILALLNIMGLSLFGVVRCWLGDIWLGLAQAISIGGCGVWALLDTVVIIVNCLEKKLTIDTLELEASFLPGTVPEAYKVTAVGLIGATLLLGLCCCTAVVTMLINVQGILMAADRRHGKPPTVEDHLPASDRDIENQRFADDSVAEGQRQAHLGPKAHCQKPQKKTTMDMGEDPIASDLSLRPPRGSGRLGGDSSPRSLVDPSRQSRLGTIARCIGTICSRPAQRPQPLPLEPAE